jgi:hypothetical protein
MNRALSISLMAVFVVFFAALTWLSSLRQPSIPEISIMDYGFPLQWLTVITTIVPAGPAQYYINWAGLMTDILIYLLLSFLVVKLLFIYAKKH